VLPPLALLPCAAHLWKLGSHPAAALGCAAGSGSWVRQPALQRCSASKLAPPQHRAYQTIGVLRKRAGHCSVCGHPIAWLPFCPHCTVAQ
jgi:hypothetical protein